ncbi:VCBS repeat-containing protein [candidate division KSB1 bacterium]|nr:MAG: VCBS repeat-containing protein [candidate division KSB1 bacterium]MBC6952355.1 VCBS repeat-containing protein [candidate division KSB1 bacterium]MCE7941665.1 VCBS repeat-containing protein [Chlorobi bacterium CHB1]MDL1876896.1 VCBS repeat-containing protein [Cytophagia bacterium CHB2]
MSTKFFTVSLTIICFSAIQSFSQTLTKITDANNPVVNDVFNSGGGSWIDVNNDGYLELFVAHGNDASQNNSLYLNDKRGGFIKVQTGALVNDGGTSIGSVWADFNHDGKLDAFVTNRFNFKNFLYLGSDDTVFTKITTGNPVTDVASSNSSSWVDVDNDGDLDLFVVNFGARHFFYRNDGAPNFNLTKIDTGLVLANNGNSIVAHGRITTTIARRIFLSATVRTRTIICLPTPDAARLHL